PCVAELPELLEVAAEYEGRATVLGVSFDLMRPTDLPEPTLAKVRQFLASRNLAFETLICERTDLGNLITRFALPDGIPITHAYDAQGKLVDSHFGIGSRERFREMLQKALGS
ncbi:MAG TPA: TlpA disulfide reductase family protein, partial [Planctomycetota bacterium]